VGYVVFSIYHSILCIVLLTLFYCKHPNDALVLGTDDANTTYFHGVYGGLFCLCNKEIVMNYCIILGNVCGLGLYPLSGDLWMGHS
jgi:hypothetical protein